MTQELDPQDLALADALDRAQDDRLASELGPIFWRFGHGGVDKSLAKAEQQRVSAIIRRDQADRAQSEVLALAELKIRDGLSVDLSDTVIAPTPEWLAQGESAVFTPRVVDGTSRVLSTRRRVVTGQCLRALRAGRLSDDQYRACAWYQDQYENSGLEGRVRSVDLASEVRAQAVSGYTFTDRQLEAQDNLRAARGSFKPRWRKFFDLVVLHDVAVARAQNMAPRGRHPWETLRTCADAVGVRLKDADPDWKKDLTDA